MEKLRTDCFVPYPKGQLKVRLLHRNALLLVSFNVL